MAEIGLLELDQTSLQIVHEILLRNIPDRPVFAFGSRTRGNARRRSDLDLAVGGTEPLTRRTIANLKDEFSESDLPIFVDVIDLTSINRGFLERIERDFIPVLPMSRLSE